VFLSEGKERFQSTGLQSGEVSVSTQAPDGTILFYDELKKIRVFRYDKDHKIEILPDIDIPANSVLFDRDGALWVGAGDGLSRMRFPDRAPPIWVGTEGGLDRFRYRNLAWFPLRGGPFSLVAGSDGDVWAGSRGESFPLVRVEDRKPAVDGPTDVFTAYRDPDGTNMV
jgi:ligand-binding sensor domain-containing protein